MHSYSVSAFAASITIMQNPNQLICDGNQIIVPIWEKYCLEMRYGPVILSKDI